MAKQKIDLKTITKGANKNLLNGEEEILKPKPVKKQGRPQKSKESVLSRKVTVNFTEAEYNQLKAISEKHYGIPIPKIIRKKLIENKII